MSFGSFFKLSSGFIALAALCAALTLLSSPAKADTGSWGAARVLQEALASNDHMDIYSDRHPSGFSLSSGLFAGLASGIDTTPSNYFGSAADGGVQAGDMAVLEDDQPVYAMMVDGRYGFDSDLGTGLPIHPYMSGGVGMAVYGAGGPAVGNLTQSGDMVPLMRVGGGVTYQVDDDLSMSVDYRAGFSASTPALATGGIANTDMQTVNMGVHYNF